VKACLRFMRAESKGLGIDPNRISVSGNSAGGHLALMLAATADVPEFEGAGGHANVATHCRACVAFYAPTQLGTGGRDARATGLFAEGASEETVRAASPLGYAAQGEFPPTLLLHGDKDELVPPRASLEMYQALRAAGTAAELHLFSNAPHGFDAARLLGRECVQLIHLFLERHG
jgi:acetyl esterase/lipase